MQDLCSRNSVQLTSVHVVKIRKREKSAAAKSRYIFLARISKHVKHNMHAPDLIVEDALISSRLNTQLYLQP